MLLFVIGALCMAYVPDVFPQSHLPDVYGSDKIVAVQTQVSDANPLEVGDEIFLFVEADGKNIIVGKVGYQTKTLPHQLVAFIQESGLTAPDENLRNGAYPNEIIQIGFYQKSTGYCYKFAPQKIVYHFDNSEVAYMKAQHLNVYKVWFDAVYQKISPPVPTAYIEYKNSLPPPAPPPVIADAPGVIPDLLPVPADAVNDGLMYVKQDGNALIIGNMTKNAMLSFEIPRPGTNLYYWSGGIQSREQEKKLTIKYLQHRHKNQNIPVKYKYKIDGKNTTWSEQKIINVPIK